MSEQLPYIEEQVVEIVRKYNPEYGDDRVCHCGHPYYRHFDTYDDFRDVGCKYCSCWNFEEASPHTMLPRDYFSKKDKP